MRIVNILIFFGCGLLLVVLFANRKKCGQNSRRINADKSNKWILFVEKHLYLLAIVFGANCISFAMTFIEKQMEIYVEKGVYGEEEREVPFLLQDEENTTELCLEVTARQFTTEELKERVAGAFDYLDRNMQGENASLSEVRKDLDYSLDYEQFPFDAEFVSEDYALIDGDGKLNNDKKDLLALGYSEDDIENGIPVNVTVTLWYGEESFEQVFSVVVFSKQKSEIEELFAKIENVLREKEKKADYEEGFYVPAMIDGVQVTRLDSGGITPVQVLVGGLVLAGLLVLREQEKRRKTEQNRKELLIRSYPWFVNEMVLLIGAGMQVRNIFGILIRDFNDKNTAQDYHKPLIQELEMAVRAMDLGMAEEQAYYQLGRRLKLPCYIKLMTLLEQNVKRGAKGMTAVLEQEELSALQERKNLAKRYGEEAGTKLLGPMILLLLVVMLMIMIPAFMGFMI